MITILHLIIIKTRTIITSMSPHFFLRHFLDNRHYLTLWKACSALMSAPMIYVKKVIFEILILSFSEFLKYNF